MKSVLIVIPTLSQGGAEKVNVLIANYLSLVHNYEISLFVFDNADFYKKLISPRIIVLQENIPINKFHSLKRWYYHYYKYGKILAKRIRHTNYDIIVSGYERLTEIAIINFILRNWGNRNLIKEKVVSIIHTSLKSIEKRSGLKTKIILLMLNFIRPFFIKNIIAVSSSIKYEFENVYGYNNLGIINNPIICSSIISEASKSPNINFQNSYFLNVGRISFPKNQLFLIKAYDMIQHLVKHNLIIMGNVQEDKIFRELKMFIKDRYLENRVRLLNAITNPYPLIKGSSAFVFSSIYEGFPLVLLEAMNLQTPIISTRFKGYENLLNENNSILVNENDVDSFANYMLKVANGEYDYSSKVNTAYGFAQNFDISVIGKKYWEYFESMQNR